MWREFWQRDVRAPPPAEWMEAFDALPVFRGPGPLVPRPFPGHCRPDGAAETARPRRVICLGVGRVPRR
eukprot:8750927-Lingulodinium_polyedra.AAC.1